MPPSIESEVLHMTKIRRQQCNTISIQNYITQHKPLPCMPKSKYLPLCVLAWLWQWRLDYPENECKSGFPRRCLGERHLLLTHTDAGVHQPVFRCQKKMQTGWMNKWRKVLKSCSFHSWSRYHKPLHTTHITGLFQPSEETSLRFRTHPTLVELQPEPVREVSWPRLLPSVALCT